MTSQAANPMDETAVNIIAAWFENLHPEEPNARRLRIVAEEMRHLLSERDALIEALSQTKSIRDTTIENCARVADSYRANAAEQGYMPQASAFEMLSVEIRALKNPAREE